MKALKTGFIFFAVVTIAMVAKAQTADEIINKYIAAIGGKDKLNSIKTLYYESSLDVMGNEAASTTYIVSGKAYKSETDFSGQKIVQCITDKGGWSVNPLMGQSAPEELPKDMLKGGELQYSVLGAGFIDYAAKGSKLELLGKEKINNASTYKLKLTTKDSAVITYYIDSATNYAVRAVTAVSANGQQIETTIGFLDYQKTDFGYAFPMKQQIDLPQGISLTVTVKKVEINKDIDPKIFDMPKS
ncbi:MAG: outer membrane lipoprotein-sorting protein [Bacteroidetes bacterium]|nr:outer membrane lipoprotein-sorting protein [Bacteroidota bacterium]